MRYTHDYDDAEDRPPIPGKIRLWDGWPMLMKSPARYVLLVFLAPSALAAALAAMAGPWWLAVMAFVVTMLAVWVFQHAFFH